MRRRRGFRGSGRFQRPERSVAGFSGTPLAGVRRVDVLRGIGLLGFGAVGARLSWLQLENWLDQVRGVSSYTDAADNNRFDLHVVPPPRGIIFDRYGEILANTSPNYRVTVVAEQARGELEEVVVRLGMLLEFSDEEVARLLRRVKNARRFDPVLVKEGLDWRQFTAVNVFLPELPGVNAEAGELRYYPFQSAFAHPIGYVQRPSQKEIDLVEAKQAGAGVYLRHPDVRVGRSGLEAELEPILKGEPGWKQVEVDASGRVVNDSTGRAKAAIPGGDVVLTLDSVLQRTALESFGPESGAAVVMDILTGEVLVLASAPSFDSNLFVNGIGSRLFRGLNEDEKKPLYDKAVAGTFSPGSTFKTIVGVAAKEAGVEDDWQVNCPGYFPYGGRNFHCWKRGGHGSVNMHRGIRESCDVFFYQAALRAGPERIAAVARRYGLGASYDISMPNVSAGVVPDPAWWSKNRKGGWTGGLTLNYGIGQGDLIVTPLQLCVQVARFANGGHAVMPRLVRQAPGAPPLSAAPPLMPGVTPEHLHAVLGGMFGVCNEPGGTAQRAANMIQLKRRPDGKIVDAAEAPPGSTPVQIAGKTGTAQVRVITAAERATGVKRDADLPWRMRDHALFIAFGPWDAPRYACAVVHEHGGHTNPNIDAPLIAAAVLRETFKRDPANTTPAQIPSSDRRAT